MPHCLTITDLHKRFGGVRALRGVSARFEAGTVHAVVGENGAGKSTVMKILAGVQKADSGTIRLDGHQVVWQNVHAAMSHGIALIHQELNLADNLDIGGNIYLGREPTRWGRIDRRKIADDAAVQLTKVGLDVDPRDPLAGLTIGNRQLVEIAKALSVGARYLIMDEPTSSLTLHESERLFDVVGTLKSSGVGVIYISHRLAEVERLADHVTVLRDGQNAGQLSGRQIRHDAMVRHMIGRPAEALYQKSPAGAGEVRLEVKALRTAVFPHSPISLQIRGGEVVGLAGLVGAGRTELLQTLFGIDRPVGNLDIKIDRVSRKIVKPGDAIAAGLALVPEDRKTHGVILDSSICDNIALPNLKRHAAGGHWVGAARHAADSDRLMAALSIKADTDRAAVGTLSGGNQQKVALAKWLTRDPSVLLLDEPTRGVDIGAKQEIYQLIEQLAARGVAVLFVSSDIEEVRGLADRVIVMHRGRVAAELTRDRATEAAVINAAVGQVMEPAA